MTTVADQTLDLAPTQYLMMEVLAARARLGETYWTFPSGASYIKAAKALSDRRFVWFKSGIAQSTIMVFLTEQGREAFLDPNYQPSRSSS